jgi:hypothetical protein
MQTEVALRTGWFRTLVVVLFITLVVAGLPLLSAPRHGACMSQCAPGGLSLR